MIGCPLAQKFNCIKPFFLQSVKSSLVPRPSYRPIFDSLHPYDGNIFTKDVDRHRNKRYAKVLYKFLAMDMEELHIKAQRARKAVFSAKKFLVCCLYSTGKCTKEGSVAFPLCQLYEVASIHRSHVQLTWPTDIRLAHPRPHLPTQIVTVNCVTKIVSFVTSVSFQGL